MDINEFQNKVAPKRKSNRLAPFISGISQLKSLGYTNQQILDWLKTNEVKTSLESVRRFTLKIKSSKSTQLIATPTTSDSKEISQLNSTPEKEPQTFGSHDPRTLDKIFASDNDLEALSRYEKRNRAESNSMKYTKQPTEEFGSHDPRALTAIFNSKPDLEALSRIAKKNRSENLKK